MDDMAKLHGTIVRNASEIEASYDLLNDKLHEELFAETARLFKAVVEELKWDGANEPKISTSYSLAIRVGLLTGKMKIILSIFISTLTMRISMLRGLEAL